MRSAAWPAAGHFAAASLNPISFIGEPIEGESGAHRQLCWGKPICGHLNRRWRQPHAANREQRQYARPSKAQDAVQARLETTVRREVDPS